MSTLARSIGAVMLAYLLAWLVSFMALVGFEPSLITRYFILGWNFNGQELASAVWLLTWPIFIIALLMFHLVRWRLSVSRKSST